MGVDDREVLSWHDPELNPEDFVRMFLVERIKAAQDLPVTRKTVKSACKRGVLPSFKAYDRRYVLKQAAIEWVPDQHASAVMSRYTVDLPSGFGEDVDETDGPVNIRLCHWRREILRTWREEYDRGRRLKPYPTVEELVPLWSEDAIPEDFNVDPDRWKPKRLTEPEGVEYLL